MRPCFYFIIYYQGMHNCPAWNNAYYRVMCIMHFMYGITKIAIICAITNSSSILKTICSPLLYRQIWERILTAEGLERAWCVVSE